MTREQSRPTGRDEVSSLFRRIRDDAGVTHGGEAARRAGVTQATVSRWETGVNVPTAQQAENYARALNANPEITRHLVALITDLRAEHRGGRAGVAFQDRVFRLEKAAATVTTFQPILVPGALQTAAYMHAVFSSRDLPPEEVNGRTASRLQRANLLSDPQRSYTFVMTYGALGWRSGDPETMARQIDHLADVSHRPNVRLGVIPWGVDVGAYPSSGFDMFDSRTVAIGYPTGTKFLNDADEVRKYVDILRALEDHAVYGDEVRELLARIAAKYRATTD